jgi:site-specific DNA recombinase
MEQTNKRCGFVIRVSTDKQARNPEGSLTNQLQRLQAHIDYKNTACGENWVEAGRYILKGVSGKDSFRSNEFAQLFSDMESGRVNTVICTALDRISRSVKDFLNFFEILTQYNVEFVCLKQNYDTTSSQGKLFITIMMALAEFERTQTSERNIDATIARAERGLWNGGQLLGYDLDANKKGYLFVNEQEKATIQFAFRTYLKCGSLIETARLLNDNGYRTKGYTTRRNKIKPPQKFGRSSMKQMFINLAYIGKKEINKKWRTQDQDKLPDNQKYRTAPAVWEPLIDEETFYKVQRLLAKNTASRHNETTPIQHVYILNSGLLLCEKCEKPMEGTCGTGHQGNKYFYYHCKHCKFKMPAGEIEQVIIDHIKKLSSREDVVETMVHDANTELQKELPQLKAQRDGLHRKLEEIKSQADGIMLKWSTIATSDNSIFLKEKLDELAKLRKDTEAGLVDIDIHIKDTECESIRKEDVLIAMGKFASLFDTLQPYQKKDIIKLVMKKAILGPEGIKIALIGKPPKPGLFDDIKSDSKLRCQTSIWLPREGSNLGHAGYDLTYLTTGVGLSLRPV